MIRFVSLAGVLAALALGGAGARGDTAPLEAAYTALQNREYDVAYELFHALASQAQDQADDQAEAQSRAQYELGAMYHRGAGVDIDVARAARWYTRAAELGYAKAQYRLGNMFLMGEGVRQSDTEAAHWYERAARQGHAGARNNLGSLKRISAAKTRQQLEQEAADLPPLEVKRKTEVKEKTGEGTGQRGFFKRWFGKAEERQPVPEPGMEQSAAAPVAGDPENIRESAPQ